MTKNPYTITNQTPAPLNPNYGKYIDLKQQGDPTKLLERTMVDPLLTNKNTKIHYNKKKLDLSNTDIAKLFISTLGERIDANSESLAKTLLAQTALNYQANSLLFKESFAVMAATRVGLPMPSVTAMYQTNVDVIPSAKNYLAGQCDFDTVFASFAFTFRPNVLAFAFKDENDFNSFKKIVANYANRPNLPSDTVSKLNDFAKEKLDDLTNNLILRASDTDDQDPYTFSRLLIKLLSAYPDAHIMPFDIGETFNPTKLILVNIDKHAHATESQVKAAWREIKRASSIKFKMLSPKHLKHLPRTSKTNNAVKQHLSQLNNQQAQASVNTIRPLAKNRPSNKFLTLEILKLINKLGKVNQSSNTYKLTTRTFNKPNRRHPDDYNLAGRATRIAYKPDLHIYLDTSGSISEDNYEQGIKACIALAKKLNIDIYFNSFSHYLSPCYKLPLKGRSLKQIYAIFQMIPKVDGGTEYANIWHYINHNKTRQKELSLCITDFGYYPPTEHFVHPKNLFYAPIDTDPSSYQYIYEYANDFLQAMNASGHHIRNQILL